jgi:hypothetical protein
LPADFKPTGTNGVNAIIKQARKIQSSKMCNYDDSLMIAPPPTCPTNKTCSTSSSVANCESGRGRRDMQVEGGI